MLCGRSTDAAELWSGVSTVASPLAEQSFRGYATPPASGRKGGTGSKEDPVFRSPATHGYRSCAIVARTFVSTDAGSGA